MNEPSLAALLEEASSVRIARVGALGDSVLATVRDPFALDALRDALASHHTWFASRVTSSTPGIVDMHFFRGQDLLAIVTYVAGGFLRWDGWRQAAQLRQPMRFPEWLTEHC